MMLDDVHDLCSSLFHRLILGVVFASLTVSRQISQSREGGRWVEESRLSTTRKVSLPLLVGANRNVVVLPVSVFGISSTLV
jgi:hypothetical protein